MPRLVLHVEQLVRSLVMLSLPPFALGKSVKQPADILSQIIHHYWNQTWKVFCVAVSCYTKFPLVFWIIIFLLVCLPESVFSGSAWSFIQSNQTDEQSHDSVKWHVAVVAPAIPVNKIFLYPGIPTHGIYLIQQTPLYTLMMKKYKSMGYNITFMHAT